MIKLIDLLKEAKQVGTLYHFTSYLKMLDIVKGDFILTSTIQPYVSFTRNKSMVSYTISQQVRMTIDGNKLSNQYEITPYADLEAGYGRAGVDESEERISLKKYPKGVNISKCLMAVDLYSAEDYKGFDPNANFGDDEDDGDFGPSTLTAYNDLQELLKEKNIPYKII